MENQTYICSKCKAEKPITDFGSASDRVRGHKSQCKICCSKYRKANKEMLSVSVKAWQEKNKDSIKANSQQYYIDNKERIDSINKTWRESNPEKAKQLSDDYYLEHKEILIGNCVGRNKIKLHTDPNYRISMAVRCSIRQSLKRRSHNKKSKTEDILGCELGFFKKYIESKFEPWMSWDNYGKYNGELNHGWDLDHIIPVSSAKSEEDILRLNQYINFQPLCSKINRDVKQNKLNYKVA